MKKKTIQASQVNWILNQEPTINICPPGLCLSSCDFRLLSLSAISNPQFPSNPLPLPITDKLLVESLDLGIGPLFGMDIILQLLLETVNLSQNHTVSSPDQDPIVSGLDVHRSPKLIQGSLIEVGLSFAVIPE